MRREPPRTGRSNHPPREQPKGRSPSSPLSGLPARRLAVALIEAVLGRAATMDEALAASSGAALEPRDRAFARLLAATVLRRLGSLDAVLARFIDRPLPKEAHRARLILLVASAQLLVLGTAPHAAINLAVEHCRRDRLARRFDKLANAVLRRVAREGAAILADLDTLPLDLPSWLWRRWSATYGEAAARRIAEASLREAPLDISVKSDADAWAGTLAGRLLPTGSIRLAPGGRIDELAGYEEGAWWVQDAAAALPVRLLGRIADMAVADLCAAPGGKTAQLAAAGARVTAVDASDRRLGILRQNLMRLSLLDKIDPVLADIETWSPAEPFDAVLLDAPCTATGTLRRHPDILHLERGADMARLARLQARLLTRAAGLLKPGGRLIYCTCSLEPEECEEQIERLLATIEDFRRVPVSAAEIGGLDALVSPTGDLRTFPFHMPMETPEMSGLDGFFAARLQRLR